KFIKEQLSAMTDRVKIIHFTQSIECSYCRETRQLMEELVLLSEKLSLEIYNFQIDREEVTKYKIDKIPATLLVAENGSNPGIRFFGIPSGYEFMSVIEDIVDISNNNHGFSEEQFVEIQKINKPVHIEVFVTPTCPYCPAAVRTAHRLALANKNITGDMIEATEFPHLAQKYQVRGVPKSIINETASIEGAVPEQVFLEKISDILR
ncbi:MAG: thioredoxin family protein, partial [Candidatus Marinimicrobia bacterium]|nr:thioredoxin family protein [Candidatus Neomarinimicrobiota bacterium]